MTVRATALALLLPLLLAGSLPSQAGEIALPSGGTLVYTDLPDLCPLDPAGSPGEAAIQEMFEAADGGRLASLLLFYDCPFVDWLRAGSTDTPLDPTAWVRIAAVKDSDGSLLQVSLSRAALLEEGAIELEQQLGGMASGDLKAALDEALARVNDSLQQLDPANERFELSNVVPLGVLAKEPEAIYAGVLASVELAGEQEVVLSVLALTLLQGHIVNIYVFRPYAGPEQVDRQLAEARLLVQDLVQRNDPEGTGGAGGLDWGKAARSGLIGGAVGAGVVVLILLWRRRRRKTA